MAGRLPLPEPARGGASGCRRLLLFLRHRRDAGHEAKLVGQGSQDAVGLLDSQDRPLDGGKTCRLRVLPNAPVKDFWSAIVCDSQTRSMLQTAPDCPQTGSLDKGWDMPFRLDGPLDAWFDKPWGLGGIERFD